MGRPLSTSDVPPPVSRSGSTILRVQVAVGERRLDVVVPARLPTGRLVPEIVAQCPPECRPPSTSVLRLCGADGEALEAHIGLAAQGVVDGDLLRVHEAGVDPVQDDLASVVAQQVRGSDAPTGEFARRRTVLGGGAGLLVLGAAALSRAGELATPTAGVVAVVLISGATVLSRARGDHLGGVVLGWLAVVYAAVAAWTGAMEGPGTSAPLVVVGAAGLAAALGSVVGLAAERLLLLPPAALAVLVGLAGPLLGVTARPQVVLLSVMTGVVIAGSLLPWLALSLTSLRPTAPWVPGLDADPQPVDPRWVRVQVQVAGRALVALQVTVALVLAMVAPVSVSHGWSGTALAGVCSLLVLMRARQQVAPLQRVTGTCAGAGCLLVVLVTALLQHPRWVPVLALGLVAAGAIVLAVLLAPDGPSVRRRWWGDLLEGCALISLPPLLTVATGLLDTVRR